jgi:hypothetical protein
VIKNVKKYYIKNEVDTAICKLLENFGLNSTFPNTDIRLMVMTQIGLLRVLSRVKKEH